MIPPAYDLRPRTARERWLRYAIAFLVCGGAVALRSALHPLFGANSTYTVFYPVVIMAALACGPRAAAIVTAALGAAGYWCFTAPEFAWKWHALDLGALGLFVLNCSVAILLIDALVTALLRLVSEQGRYQAAAEGNAELFRELNERVTHHLQLVSGLLALQARDESNAQLSSALRQASEQSSLLARVHREVGGRAVNDVEFTTFARQLARATLASRGVPMDQVVLVGPELRLPAPQATSLAVALLECLGVILDRGSGGRVQVRLELKGHRCHMRIVDLDEGQGVSVVTLANGYLLRAMVEQMGGQVSVRTDHRGPALDIAFALPGRDLPKPDGKRILH